MWYSNFKEEIFQRVWFSNITQSYQISIIVETHLQALHYKGLNTLNKKKQLKKLFKTRTCTKKKEEMT